MSLNFACDETEQLSPFCFLNMFSLCTKHSSHLTITEYTSYKNPCLMNASGCYCKYRSELMSLEESVSK